MKYIEELNFGDTFVHNNAHFILTIDSKKDGSKLAISLLDGKPLWFNPTSIVEKISLYTLDTANNIIPLKKEKNEYHI